MANRMRKVQNAQVWTWRVANTTTSNTQSVYRIPTGRNNRECDVLAYEVLGTAPIEVRIEWNNVYRVSLDTDALQNIIENTALDFSNVELTLWTVNGAVEFTGNIKSDGTFTWAVVNAESIDTNTLNSSSITTIDIVATNARVANLDASESKMGVAEITEAKINNEEVQISSIKFLTAEEETVTGLLKAEGWVEVKEWINVLTGDVTVEENVEVKWSATLNTAKINELEVITNATLAEAEVTGNTKLNTVTATGTATLADTVVSRDLTVAGNTTIAWTTTLAGNTTATNLSTSGVLTTNGTTVMNGSVEAHNNVTVDGTLRANGNVEVKQSVTVGEQLNAATIRTDEVVADEVRVNKALYLSADAEAPDFILQKEKGQPNGVPVLDDSGKLPLDQLPIEAPTCTFFVGTGVFTNSDTAVIEDARIKLTSYVNISNYNDIIWDLNEVIWEWGLTVTSNETETGSFKYFIVTPIE